MKKQTKPNNFWGTLLRLLRYLSSKIWWVVAVVILASLSAFLNAQLPRVMGMITNHIFDGVSRGLNQGQFQIDFEAVKRTVLLLAMIYFLAAIFRYFQQFLTSRISQHTVYELRRDMKAKMERLPISYFDSHSHGDILSRAINDMEQVANSLGQTITQVTTSTVQIVAILGTMLSLSGPLALIVILMAPTILLSVRLIAPRSQRQFGLRQAKLGILNDFIEEVYSGQEVVKVYNQEDYETRVFDQKSEELNEASWKAEFYAGLMNPMVGAIKDMAYIGVAFFGGLMVISNQTKIGTVQAFLQYVNQFSNPFRMLAQLANSIQMTVSAIERVFEVLDEEEMTDPIGLESQSSPYKVSFDQVDFGYDADQLILEDFDLQVKEGEMIAIVGPTGAGKTTLINLLERFYDVSGGAIRLEGQDIRNIPRVELRDRFSMVLQDTWLFSGTIWDNLRYGSEDATDKEIIEAAKAAYVHDFVQMLPQGYQTMLSEDGSNLSQGQRQLITIARAFLRNPEIIILDEATSSVDTRTEVLIQKAMRKLLDNRTSFVVAHRLSTIRNADKIVVMNRGQVVEQGTHQELMDANGFYSDLYQAQYA